MILYIDGKRAEAGQQPGEGARLVCIAGPGAMAAAPALPELAVLDRLRALVNTRFESREGHDYISIEVPDVKAPLAEPNWVQMMFSGARLVVLHSGLPAMDRVAADLEERGGALSPERVMYLVFAHLTEHDTAALDDMEEEIARLEDSLLRKVAEDGASRISDLRKRLLALKRYYEALFDLLEDLEENVNGFITKGQLRSFRILTNRADRLSRAVLNLRDYVTQVRESYQNQLDISLNETMKLFTVITTVFLPPTLLVGWYGMNFRMPEYDSPVGYPIVIAVCVAAVVLSLVYFKRKKWF